MKFKDLKTGYSVYILDKTNMSFNTEKVSNISLPHIDSKITSTNMVVDVTMDSGTYCMSADSEITYPYNKVISTERSHILREVEGIKTTIEQRLANVENDKEVLAKCNRLIADLDPAQKEKQATEARFANLEASMDKMMAMLTKLTE